MSVLTARTVTTRPAWKHARTVVVLLLLASFGPYLVPAFGFRLEHLVIYMIASYTALLLILSARLSSDTVPLLSVALLLATAAVWTLISSVGGDRAGVTASMRLAGLENFIQPSALVLVIAVIVRPLSHQRRVELLEIGIVTYLIAISFNAVLALATIRFDVWPIVKYFVVSTSAAGLGSVWERSAVLGRYLGLFNQPIEAGLAYSVAMIGWAYLVGLRTRISAAYWLALSMIVIGGILSVSKTFLFVGFPVGLLYWLLISGRSQVFKVRTFGAVGVGIAGVGAALSNWQAVDYATRFLNTAGSAGWRPLIAMLSSGRYGTGESTVKQVFRQTAREAPFHGLGYGAFPTLENAYLEYFALGGLIALSLYISVIGLLAMIGLRGLRARIAESYLLCALTILIVIAGLGGPVLTLNRASIPLVVLVMVSASIVLSQRPMRGPRRRQSMQDDVLTPSLPAALR